MYRKIHLEVFRAEGFTIKNCWIADVKEQLGIPMKKAPNRLGPARRYPCPETKRDAIIAAMRRLELI
jgi:hypothetical protein